MLQRIRAFFGCRIERFLAGSEPITILSEDCWGGEFCRTLQRPYTTPLAGSLIPPRNYLNFLENITKPDALAIEPVPSSESHPVGKTPYATIHFLHFATWDEAKDKFQRRSRRIAWHRLYYKIDFGKPGYTQRDVERWNSLHLNRCIALIPVTTPPGLDFTGLHNAVRVPDWCDDGSAMFYAARRHFSFHDWIHTGRLRQSLLAQTLNILLYDLYYPSLVRNKLRGLLPKT